jgi:transcriptional regulator of acetoin/glycerol metabolism
MRQRGTSDEVQAARHRFFDDGQAPRGLVSDTILQSWQRCRSGGLHADGSLVFEPIPRNVLGQLHEEHGSLLQLCRSELEMLYASARDNGSIVVLTGPDGTILDALGSADFLSKAARVALRPGVSWHESFIGTNAIGTAIVERKPVEVRGGEHYMAPHRVLSCSASPILDPRGRVAGVLDLSGHAAVHHMHALGMVKLSVEQIERRLFERAFADRDIIRMHLDPAMLGTANEGLLVFEEHRLVAANRHAMHMLGLDWDELGRRRYDELFQSALPRPGETHALRSHAGDRLHSRRGTDGPRTFVMPARTRTAVVPPPKIPRQPAPIFDATLEQALERSVRLLDADIPVLLQGETGTGKEVVAREIHRRGNRAHAPFIAINCAALPESLIEAELFGYAPGAFTGARREGMPGLLREAEGGVLFLDEIGDMPLGLQSRLLRVLQEREVVPLGGQRAVALDFALISASHQDIGVAVQDGRFRADLYYRIAQSSTILPPLRERDDVSALITRLWTALGAAEARIGLSAAVVQELATRTWPGNVRQLVSVLKTVLALATPGHPVQLADLPVDASSMPVAMRACTGEATLDHLASAAIEQALQACKGNISAAARRLGISRSTLHRRLAR